VTGYPATVTFSMNGETARSARLRLAGEGNEAVRFAQATPSAEQLRGYAGSYWSPELSVTWKLDVRDGKLFLDSGSRSFVPISGPLDPAMTDAFVGGAVFVKFTRDGAGRITGFDVSASRMRDIRFDARAP
jgi:hypothetical protein